MPAVQPQQCVVVVDKVARPWLTDVCASRASRGVDQIAHDGSQALPYDALS